MIIALTLCLKSYNAHAKKFTDQIERRLLKGEAIPTNEKIYSIFEEHTEWITKGKLNKKVELGHLLLITTDQYQLIVDYKIMEGEKDAAQVEPLKARIQLNYADKKAGVFQESRDILITLTFLSTFLLVTILGAKLLTRKSVVRQFQI